MKHILRYRTNQQFHDDQLAKSGKDVQPGQCVWSPIPGVSFTDESKISDYNPVPKKEPAVVFINNTNEAATVTLTARHLGNELNRVSANIPHISLDYSTNGTSFQTKESASVPASGDTLTFELPANGKLWLKGENTTLAVGDYKTGCSMSPSQSQFEYPKQANIKFWSFSCDKSHSVSGVSMALVNNAEELTAYMLAGLFNDDTTLQTISDNFLPSVTNIPNGAYARMFENASNLSNMPNVYGDTVGIASCYKMFYNTGIVASKPLPAVTISEASYRQMFSESVKFRGLASLPAETISIGSYEGMFAGCSSMTIAPEVASLSAFPFCCSSMFDRCESLVTPAVMHFQSFWGVGDPYYAVEACEMMYKRCHSLTSMPAFLAEVGGSNYVWGVYQHMFDDCTSLVNVVNLGNTVVQDYMYKGMFSGCTSLVTAPRFLTTRARNNAYESTFAGCTSLTGTAQMDFTTFTAGATDTMLNMYEGCTSLTSATLPNVATLSTRSYKNMFKGCSRLAYINCPATNLSAEDCTLDWVNGVAANGTFVKASSADWSSKTGNDGIPAGWTVQNAS